MKRRYFSTAWTHCICMLQEIFSLLCLYGLYFLRPFLSFDRTNAKANTDDLFPLILVHPAIQNRAAWYFYQIELRKAGFFVIYHFEYSCGERSLHAVARRLAALVEEVVRLNPGKKPVLMGASLGGLVARTSLCFLSSPESLGGLFTLACPHHGSRLAKLVPQGLFPLLHSIFYDSPAIQKLEAWELSVPVNIPKLAVLSELDEIVKPLSALHPPANQGWREIKTPPLGHMAIMLHRPTINHVISELQRL